MKEAVLAKSERGGASVRSELDSLGRQGEFVSTFIPRTAGPGTAKSRRIQQTHCHETEKIECGEVHTRSLVSALEKSCTGQIGGLQGRCGVEMTGKLGETIDDECSAKITCSSCVPDVGAEAGLHRAMGRWQRPRRRLADSALDLQRLSNQASLGPRAGRY